MIEHSIGGDGTLPGGMQMMKSMMSDPELVAMLRSPKMQDAMKAIILRHHIISERRLSKKKYQTIRMSTSILHSVWSLGYSLCTRDRCCAKI